MWVLSSHGLGSQTKYRGKSELRDDIYLSVCSEYTHCDLLSHAPAVMGFLTLTDCISSDCEPNRPFFSQVNFAKILSQGKEK